MQEKPPINNKGVDARAPIRDGCRLYMQMHQQLAHPQRCEKNTSPRLIRQFAVFFVVFWGFFFPPTLGTEPKFFRFPVCIQTHARWAKHTRGCARAHITKPVLTGSTFLYGEALPLMVPASSLVSPGVRLSCHGRPGKPDGRAETRKRNQDFHWWRWINRLYFDFHSCFSFPPPPLEEEEEGGGVVAVPDNYPAVLSVLCHHGGSPHQHKASFFSVLFCVFSFPIRALMKSLVLMQCKSLSLIQENYRQR